MSLTDSPDFGDELENENSPGAEDQEQPSGGKQRRSRVVIAVLVIAILISGALLVVRSPNTGSSTGSVTLRGEVVNAEGEAVPNAIVYVEGMSDTTMTDDSGAFSISNAPDGQLILVIGVTPEPPHFVELNASAGSTDLGEIVLQ